VTAPAQLTSFLSRAELEQVGFQAVGHDVQVSRFARIYRPEVIRLGQRVRIDDFAILSGGQGIDIGNYVHIAAYACLYGAAGIVMEDFTGLSARVTLYSASDDFSGASLQFPMIPEHYKPGMSKGPVVIRTHGTLGVNATVMPNVVIAEGCAVGGHSFVLHSTEPWSIHVGCPAR